MIEEKIRNRVKEVLRVENVELEIPEREEHGDLSTNIAMQIFSSKDEILLSPQNDERTISEFDIADYKSPKQLADYIVGLLKNDQDLSKIVREVEVAGPGFINFWMKVDLLIGNLQNVLEMQDNYGKTDVGEGKKVIVEYSSPNIAKPFTIGHLRSTVIGDAIANLLEATGWKVYRDNHIGDWGTQFGKQIYAIKIWGDEKKIENSDNPVKELVQLYVKFHKEAEKDPSIVDKGRKWFKKLEQGDEEARNIWKKCVEWSWQEFQMIYDLLGVSFSEEFNGGRGLGESFFEDKMEQVVKELEERGLLKEGEEGAKLVFFEDDKLPPAMILKKDGTTLYHTRDLATDSYRKEMYDPDLIVNEVGAEQTLYFRQLFEMEKMLGWFEESQRVHVPHGLIRFKDKKMSTRKGNVIWMEELIEEARKKAWLLAKQPHDIEGSEVISSQRDKFSDSAKKKILGFAEHSNLSDIVAVGALKWNDLKRDPKTEIVFDWDEMLSMEGNSGPYLQYTYARTQSVLRKVKGEGQEVKLQVQLRHPEEGSTTEESRGEDTMRFFASLNSAQDDAKEGYSFNEDEEILLRHLVHYSGTIVDAAKNYSPNLLANYLYELAQKYNTFYNKHRIVDAEEGKEAQHLRLALTAATGQVLKNGLDLLGINVPDKM